MNTIPFKEKKRVSIFLTEEKEKELKKKAIDAGKSFSDYLSIAGTITPIDTIKQAPVNSGGVALPK